MNKKTIAKVLIMTMFIGGLFIGAQNERSKPAKTTEAANQYYEEVYRLYNPNSGEHHYTTGIVERNHLISVGWNDEGIGWYAPTEGDPVYRVYNPYSGEHHYTADTNEANTLKSMGWNDEGISWYSAKRPSPGCIWADGYDCKNTVIIWRNFNPYAPSAVASHNYTSDKNEYEHLIYLGWNGEKNAFLGVEPAGWTAEQEAKNTGTGSTTPSPTNTPSSTDTPSSDSYTIMNSDNIEDIFNSYTPEDRTVYKGTVSRRYGETIILVLPEPYYNNMRNYSERQYIYIGPCNTEAANIHGGDESKEYYTVYVNGHLDAPIEIAKYWWVTDLSDLVYDYCWETYPEACSSFDYNADGKIMLR